MREVSKEAFYRVVGPMNVNPRTERDHSDWIDQTTHRVIGRTTPGYFWEGVMPAQRYFLVPELAVRS